MPYEDPDIFDYEREKADHLASPPTTEADADRHYARELGAERPDCEWILSDRDVWYKNPFYSGPPGPHPEDDYGPASQCCPTPSPAIHEGQAYCESCDADL